MKPLLYTPCARQWVLSDIIYIYTLEPTSFSKAQASNLMQKTAAGTLLNAALKRVVTSNVVFLVGTAVIAGGLCYAINRYKERSKRRKEAALADKANNTQHPIVIIPPLSKPQDVKPDRKLTCN
ncbi:MAG TPA: hypothetical protein VD794_15645 [Flavisolibacter sp.]|nr:hypothetical protein [Flavisolibacter sp.]